MTEIHGGVIHTGYGDPYMTHKAQNGIEIYILDRANCHKIVRRYNAETRRMLHRVPGLSPMRRAAMKELKRLNDAAE